MNRKMKEKKRMKKIGAALLLVFMLLNISIITALADMSYTLKYTSGGPGGTVVREESGTVAADPADPSGATYEMINLLSEFTEGNFKYTLENNQPDLENAGRFLPDEPGFIPDNNPIASPSFAVYVREEMIFRTTAIYVDENDNHLMNEALSGTDGEWKPLQREFEVNGIWYEVPEQPQLDPDFYRYDAAAGGEIKPDNAPGDFTVNCVRKPAVQPRRYGYEIHYTDEAGNILIPDQGGAAEDMEWVALNMEFTATQHDAGSIYIVRQAQGYPDYQYEYISASSARVRIGHNFPGEYSIVCVKKPAGGGSSSNGGGSSSGGGGRSSGGGSSSTGRSSAKNSPNQTVKQGWILENNIWYYYSGTTRSTLKKGWHLDPQDGFWYYLDLNTGAMFTDWYYINGEWYYFNPYTPMWTWEQHSDGEWYYKGIEKSRPLGSMYAGDKTPDGYMVDSEGHWVH